MIMLVKSGRDAVGHPTAWHGKDELPMLPQSTTSPTPIDLWVHQRFWSKVQRSEGCWTWLASKSRRGYGQFNYQGRSVQAHRLAYQFAVGPIPEGMQVCHHCDNPPCVNPTHLFLGTNGDNVRDCVQKGRHGFDPQAKITRADAETIRRRYAAGGVTQRGLGREYGITHGEVWNILSGQRWPSGEWPPTSGQPEEVSDAV